MDSWPDVMVLSTARASGFLMTCIVHPGPEWDMALRIQLAVVISNQTQHPGFTPNLFGSTKPP